MKLLYLSFSTRQQFLYLRAYLEQDLGLQCQTSVRLKVVAKSIWALFEAKNLFELNIFLKLSSFLFKFVFDPCLLGLKKFSGPQNFSWVTKEIFCTPFLWTRIVLDSKLILCMYSFLTQNFEQKNFEQKTFLWPNTFWPQILLSLKISKKNHRWKNFESIKFWVKNSCSKKNWVKEKLGPNRI